ncbi:MAG TPA: hypothetical protein VGN93_11445 [Shinella sp.]|jgi:hypothetical protein|uniref:hypothetical protein n=1 Tax=Shinella sp. TaxID=1870904 RepID=UPI0029A7BF95|nr:hypothetical protein [Shinella sp.]MDX3978494.1 hypothetical protein [Shinella sp.]HEV7247590.1 hypothetical protein [Shinella sp.]
MIRDTEQFNTWHKLFDALCEESGFSDNMSLAARYCEMTGSHGQKQFDTAVRNLNNWRTGRHLPRPRSVRVLSRLLKVETDPGLMVQWNTLYDQVRNATDDPVDEAAEETVMPVSTPRRTATAGRSLLMGLAGIGLFSLGVATGLLWESQWRPWRTSVDDAPLVTYLPEVRLVVGQSRIIHGERGDCGRLPREWRDVWGNLPSSRIGEFSDAGVVRRYSMFCKGVTPARGIRFTAKTPGTEEMYVTGDYMKITVVDEASLTAASPNVNENER